MLLMLRILGVTEGQSAKEADRAKAERVKNNPLVPTGTVLRSQERAAKDVQYHFVHSPGAPRRLMGTFVSCLCSCDVAGWDSRRSEQQMNYQ